MAEHKSRLVYSTDRNIPQKGPCYRVLAACAVTYARVSQAFLRAMVKLGNLFAGILESALDTGEKHALTLRLYDTASEKYAVSGGLFGWEAAWYGEALPAAPAKILVTAAGRGREVLVLLKSGYSVDAAEPVAKFAAECAGLPGVGDVFQADHDAVIQAIIAGNGPAAALRGRSYDAVIIGWGGFNHIIDAAQRHRLLSACHALTPQGPILLSFFVAGGQPKPEGQAIEIGRAAGRCLARLRGVTAAGDADDIFLWHAGFCHCFSEKEIEALAASLGRRATFSAEPYGHATLLPPAPTSLGPAVIRKLMDLL